MDDDEFDSNLGTTLAGTYEILEQVSQDATSVAYKARHLLMPSDVRVRFLKLRLSGDGSSVKEFQRLVKDQSAGRVPCAEGIPIIDFGIAPSGQPYAIYSKLK